jgi:hypothetical protein
MLLLAARPAAADLKGGALQAEISHFLVQLGQRVDLNLRNLSVEKEAGDALLRSAAVLPFAATVFDIPYGGPPRARATEIRTGADLRNAHFWLVPPRELITHGGRAANADELRPDALFVSVTPDGRGCEVRWLSIVGTIVLTLERGADSFWRLAGQSVIPKRG